MLAQIAEVRSGSIAPKGKGAAFLQGRNIRPGSLDLTDPSEGGVPKRSSNEAALREGDVVLTMRGGFNPASVVGSAAQGRQPLFASLDVAILRPHEDRVLSEYLMVVLNLPQTQKRLAAERTVGTLPRISLEALKNLEIPVPDLARQRLIAETAAEAARTQSIMESLIEAQQRLVHALLRNAAEEPMPGSRPTWDNRRSQASEQEMRAFSTQQNGASKMPTSNDGRKSGTTHVVPAPQGGWNVKKGGAGRASSHHDTKQEAVNVGRDLSRKAGTEFKIHNRDGRIAQSDSHGNDPKGIKG